MQGSWEKSHKKAKKLVESACFFRNLQIYCFRNVSTSLSLNFNSKRIILAQIIMSKYSSRQFSLLYLLYKEGKKSEAICVCYWKLSIGEDRKDCRPNRDVVRAGYAETRNSNRQKNPARI